MTTNQEKIGRALGMAPEEMIASNRRAFDWARKAGDVGMMEQSFLALELHARELLDERDKLAAAGQRPAPSDTEIGEQMESIRRTVLGLQIGGMRGHDIEYEDAHGRRVYWMVVCLANAYLELRAFLDTEAQRTVRDLLEMTAHATDPDERVREMASELVGHGWRPVDRSRVAVQGGIVSRGGQEGGG